MVGWHDHILDKEWQIEPAGGLTGDAFVAKKGNQRLFLKRNSSPFLAVLSAENIVPKLVWTKRMENGDVITAQQWIDSRKLQPEEMQSRQVLEMIHKIHHSSELLHMLMRLGKKPNTTNTNFTELKKRIDKHSIYDYKEVKQAIDFLQQLLRSTKNQKQVVCHSDLNHNNFILTKEGQLYLVDWDNAMIGDPVKDFGSILFWYIEQRDWDKWLGKYGIKKNQQLLERMYWYLLYDALYYITWHLERREMGKVLERREDLKTLNYQIRTTILA